MTTCGNRNRQLASPNFPDFSGDKEETEYREYFTRSAITSIYWDGMPPVHNDAIRCNIHVLISGGAL